MPNFFQATQPARSRRVLVVEDDAVNRTFLRIALEKRGYHVFPVQDVGAAQREFGRCGAAHFDCVISDYWLPDQTGLDLLRWLKTEDPSLATIMLTAEGERKLITESLRLGATDFLEKPVNVDRLMAALEKAASQTVRQRHMLQSESAMVELGRTQRWMVQAVEKDSIELFFQPKFEAGGDFFAHFRPTPDTQCCLLTDVSGHDPQAAYISAYFHGIFRGMLMCETPQAAIFAYFNNFLVNEWNLAGKIRNTTASGTSVAAVAMFVDAEQKTASTLICGSPEPVCVLPDGRVQTIGANSGPPLGWFADVEIQANVRSVAGGGTVYMWTDGLADLAESLGVHPLCLAFALRQKGDGAAELPLVKSANDDILCATIYLPDTSPEIGALQPLILGKYRGDQVSEIDGLEYGWRRSLRLALPDLTDAMEHDMLLAAREAVLNGMEHGCAGAGDKLVSFQASYHRIQRIVRIWVEDPGNGHDFDVAAHANALSQTLADQHRGLIIITNLAHHVKFERGGATLIMDFQL